MSQIRAEVNMGYNLILTRDKGFWFYLVLNEQDLVCPVAIILQAEFQNGQGGNFLIRKENHKIDYKKSAKMVMPTLLIISAVQFR